MKPSQILGFVGTCIVAAAYISQIRHLIKEHCSAGINIRVYILRFLGALFFLAIRGHDQRHRVHHRADFESAGYLRNCHLR